MREDVIKGILENKVVAIVRGYTTEECVNLAKALLAGGVSLMEVTFPQTTEDEMQYTADTIKALNEQLGDKMYIGAGTVTSVKMVKMAKNAGAKFIISPDLNKRVVKATRRADMVSIPGALTPTEMKTAYDWGADFIKVFPANLFGPSYFKTVLAPLSQLKLLAVGGANETNINDYLAAGACGAGVASCLFKKEWIKAGEWNKITEAAKSFCAIIKGTK